MSNLRLFPDPPRRPPPDAHVRAEALDIQRSFIVQAPAGSGKTTLLIQRFLKLLADPSISEPEQVLAITFTNAATADLRDRVLRILAKAGVQQSDVRADVISIAASRSPGHGSEDTGEIDELTLNLARDVAVRDAELGWQLLAHPHRLRIRTIDSVCAEMARSLPVLSGSGGALAPSEDAASLYREAARRTLLLLGSGDARFDSAVRNLLLHRDGNLANCESLIAEMLALRDQWGDLVPLSRSELDDAWLDANLLPQLERTLDHAICATLQQLDQVFPPDVLHQLASLAAHLGHLPGTNGASPIACCAGLADPPRPIAAHLDCWRALLHLLIAPSQGNWRKPGGLQGNHLRFAYDRKHPHHAQLAAILDQLSGRDELLQAALDVVSLPPARYPAEQWQVAKSLFRVLSRALVELQLVFVERGQCDFAELGLLARATLRSTSGAGDLASALGAKLQHLLVDEMQDTSAGHYELLELLTASWDGHSQTVFLVGDPYQSIYLFRQARMERFLHSLETCHLGELPLTRLVLTANFRSQANLVEHFNADFSSIFSPPSAAADNDSPARAFIHASPIRPPAPTAAGRIWQLHAKPPSQSSEAAQQLQPTQAHHDAAEIARIAAGWLERPLPAGREKPWRIAVLVRSRIHLAEVVPALRRAAVPFRAVEIESLQERQEVLDLTALTRALLHPGDRVAGLAVLRAPWCGLPLADLHTLTGADDSALRELPILRLIEDRAELLSPDSQLRIARVASVLRSAAAARARQSVAQLVERAWQSLGGDAPLTPAERTNTRRFFEVLDAAEAAAGRVDAALLERRLAQLYAEPDPLPPDRSCVELLTIHKAKGLEWDVVLVPALDRQPARNSNRLLTWSLLGENAEQDVMLAPIAARGDDSGALTQWLRKMQSARERAENKRLFYVACTRAAQELHLFGEPSLNASPAHPDSLLAAAWPAVQLNAASHRRQLGTPEIAPSVEALTDDDAELPQVFAIAAQGADNAPPQETTSAPTEAEAAERLLLAPSVPPLTRLPSTFDPRARFALNGAELPYGDLPAARRDSAFARPEGSLAARSFGNAVHVCLELLATRIASGATPAQLLAELPSWSVRIAALLRTDGLSEAQVKRLTREARAALEAMLRDPDGQWLLAAHRGAASEFSLTIASEDASETAQPGFTKPISVRVDRLFHAGATPHAPGDSHLWIVDYKTAAHSTADIDAFFAAQRAAYAPQLEAYGRILARAHSFALENVRLALYFPALAAAPRLLWWPLAEHATPHATDRTQLQLTLEI